MVEARAERAFLIAFVDFTRYTARAAKLDDATLADTLDEYYVRVAEAAGAGSGRVVKFIGDGALLVFPDDHVDAGVHALLDLKESCDAWFASLGWDSRLLVKAHFGTVMAGPFGPEGDRRFDVIGANVNIAATIASRGFALSPEAFRKLAPETRKQFEKHTPPVTYIRQGDPRPHRTAR